MNAIQIVAIVILITIGFAIQAIALFGIKEEIANAFGWYRLKQEQDEKKQHKIYKLQTDIESEKNRNSELQLRLDIATGKIKTKNIRNEVTKIPPTTLSE